MSSRKDSRLRYDIQKHLLKNSHPHCCTIIFLKCQNKQHCKLGFTNELPVYGKLKKELGVSEAPLEILSEGLHCDSPSFAFAQAEKLWVWW